MNALEMTDASTLEKMRVALEALNAAEASIRELREVFAQKFSEIERAQNLARQILGERNSRLTAVVAYLAAILQVSVEEIVHGTRGELSVEARWITYWVLNSLLRPIYKKHTHSMICSFFDRHVSSVRFAIHRLEKDWFVAYPSIKEKAEAALADAQKYVAENNIVL